MVRLLAPLYLSLLFGLFGYLFSIYREQSQILAGLVGTGAAILAFVSASVKSMLESRKVYYEGLIAKEKWERTDSRIHVPTAAEVEKLRKLPRERVPVSVRPFISETSEQSGGT